MADLGMAQEEGQMDADGSEECRRTGVGEEKMVLLPRTANTTELWPALVTKAILKVAALEYVPVIREML